LKHTVYELAKDTGSMQARLLRIEPEFAGDFVSNGRSETATKPTPALFGAHLSGGG
jgi:hypothetical protein